MEKNNKKKRHSSQCLSAEILAENTISCGAFYLPAEPVVSPEKTPLPRFWGQIQLDFLPAAGILAGCL
jgi:hypothetical protein